MNPDDFLSLAIRLSNSAGEAEKRSAISRAYYGLFHAARLLVEDCGVRCPESAETHDKVAKCLQNSGNDSLVKAGNQLASFRTFRNHADYRLTDSRFRDAKFIQIQLSIANVIHASVANARANVASIQESVRMYAKDVLRLSVEAID